MVQREPPFVAQSAEICCKHLSGRYGEGPALVQNAHLDILNKRAKIDICVGL
jgi:hypothetical protein